MLDMVCISYFLDCVCKEVQVEMDAAMTVRELPRLALQGTYESYMTASLPLADGP
jgi:hypothetical protein